MKDFQEMWNEFSRKFRARFGINPNPDFYTVQDIEVSLGNGNLERTLYK